MAQRQKGSVWSTQSGRIGTTTAVTFELNAAFHIYLSLYIFDGNVMGS